MPVLRGTCGSRVGTVVGYRGMRRLGLGDAYDARYRIYDAQLRLFWSKDPLGWVDGYDRWAYLRLITVIFAEQHDEWAVGRRYFSLESMAAIRPQPTPQIEVA